jgi:hypothetical protein
MEADDIPDFDPGDTGGDAFPDTTGDASPETPAPANDGMPPEMNTTNDDDFGFNPEGENTETDMGDMSDTNEEEQDPDDNKEGENIGEKTNAIFNQRLYEQLTSRNTSVENTLEQLQGVIPVLPYETVQELDKPLNQLKTALAKGQSYAIDKFINAEYGENLLFYEKLNSVYTLIEDKIDHIIKRFKKDKSS